MFQLLPSLALTWVWALGRLGWRGIGAAGDKLGQLSAWCGLEMRCLRAWWSWACSGHMGKGLQSILETLLLHLGHRVMGGDRG